MLTFVWFAIYIAKNKKRGAGVGRAGSDEKITIQKSTLFCRYLHRLILTFVLMELSAIHVLGKTKQVYALVLFRIKEQ